MPLCWVTVPNTYSNNLQLFRDVNDEQVFTLLKMCVILVGQTYWMLPFSNFTRVKI